MDPTEFILPLAGIALIVVLVWVSGGARLHPISKAAAHEALFAEGLSASRILIDRDGAAGLAWLDSLERVALIRRMGRDIGVTVLEPGDIRRLDLTGEPLAMTLRFRSIGQAPARLLLQDEGELERWRKTLMLYGELNESLA